MEVNIKDGYKVTEVGVIPDDWEEVLLDSVAKRGSGHTPNKRHSEYWKGDIKWISLKDSNRFDNIYIYDTNEKITLAGIANSSAVLHPSESVVLSRDAGVGKSAITKDVMAVSQHFFAWQCGLKLDNHFLYYWLQSQKPEFERIANGTTIKTIGIPYFQKYKIPLPPLSEQKAIAHALSDVDNLITAIDQLITKKRNIKQGTMQQLLTGKKRLPGFNGKWEVKKLGDIAGIQRGASPRPIDSPIWYDRTSSVGWVRISDITASNGRILEKTRDYLSQKGILQSRFLSAGSLIMSICATVGIPVITNIDTCIHDGFLGLTKLNNIDQVFLYYKLKELENNFKSMGQTGSQNNLNTNLVKKYVISLPPLPEQKAIAEIFNDIDKEIEALEKNRDKYKAIKQGMMQELLTGKTRIQIPDFFC
ncbi:restriction endonuclease subunit S [Anabaena sp. UHCC 0253]|uniref:restriction endonuclease subunit S n=1 Tax=Anabaena sp. UHCC 0253 TaxID=2590019 RepID=UPI001445472C|nr:restriction endonuclease subunit S [Anabaena sp. UHCC 0253]MTJ55377.1 restriction endonuclease subunit S [Anabaena sp. UHCC 0253]